MNIFEKTQFYWARHQLQSSRADFYYDLASSMDDRVPVFNTIRKYEERARKRHQASKYVYAEMLRRLQSGSVAHALSLIATDSERVMIEAISSSGDASMADGLRFLSDQVEKTKALANTMRKAVTYPLVLLVIFAAMFAGFSLFVVPVIAEIFPPPDWPLLGRMLYAASQVVRNFGLIIALAFFMIFLIFLYSLPRWTSPIRRLLDGFMPYGLYREYCGAMLLVSLATMMRSGVSLRSAIERSERHSSTWLRWHLRQILIRLSSPKVSYFGQAFQTGLLSPYLEDRVIDASERRNPVDSFVRIGVGSIDKLIASIERSAGKLNGAMLMICGVILIFMIGGFMATALEIQSGVSKQLRG